MTLLKVGLNRDAKVLDLKGGFRCRGRSEWTWCRLGEMEPLVRVSPLILRLLTEVPLGGITASRA